MMLPMDNFEFVSKLTKQFINNNSGDGQNFDQKNFVFSPASVSTTLALGLYMLVDQDKETQRAIMGNASKEDFLRKIYDRTKKGRGQNGRDAKLLDQILIDSRNFELEESVRQSLRGIEKETCFKNVNFKSVEQMTNDINRYIFESTNGRIKNIISTGQLDPNAGILMISAANFVGLWSDQFLTSKTKNQPFNITAQTRINLDMMSRMDDKGWFEDNDVQILELDFNGGGGKASLILLLPQQRNGLQDLILNKMTGSKLNDWINSTHVTNVWMEIPRFNVVNSFEIDDQLIGIGVKIFFDENQTFSGIKAATNQKPKVSGFYHGACMEINEKGVNAAPTTSRTTTTDPMPADSPNVEEPAPPPQVPKRFIADHPFLFLITMGDRDDKIILFLGQFYGQ